MLTYLRPKELSKKLNISERTLRNWKSKGVFIEGIHYVNTPVLGRAKNKGVLYIGEMVEALVNHNFDRRDPEYQRIECNFLRRKADPFKRKNHLSIAGQ
jgi:hypothetical protein